MLSTALVEISCIMRPLHLKALDLAKPVSEHQNRSRLNCLFVGTGKNVGVVTASTVSSLIFLLLVVVVVVAAVVYHHSVVYQRKKMREKEVEDYKKLLDLPDGVDYAEYCEDT